MKASKIIWERVYKAGYILRRELIETSVVDAPTHEWTMAYAPSGGWIGTPEEARLLCFERGIRPEKSDPKHCVCSIGWSHKDGKWYGWSHRAIFGFKIGSTCKKGDCHYVPKNRGGRGEWKAETVADARQMAIDFAEGVS